jgi:hypothetical protein
VAKELGHGGDSLVKRIYGHLGEVRHRSEVVEYRITDHAERLGERLGRLYSSDPQRVGPQNGTTNGTTAPTILQVIARP